MHTSTNKLQLVEAIKGLGIILVVAAHLIKYGTPGIEDWYAIFKFKVYLFHMPLLMFMSGYVFRFANHHTRAISEYSRYIRQRANRLLLPFLFIGFVTIIGKLLAASSFNIDEAPPDITSGIISLFYKTESSPVLTIWYLFVLFSYCVATPILLMALGNRWGVLFALSIMLHFIKVDDIIYANRIFQYYIFFVMGCYFAHTQIKTFHFGHLTRLLALIAFFFVLTIPWDRDLGLLICGLLSCMALPALIEVLPDNLKGILAYFGSRSMSIYLLNVIFIGLAKIFYAIAVPTVYQSFSLLLLITFIFGLFGPLIFRFFVDSIPALRKTFGTYLS